jgi:hypothetical protein
MARSRRRERGAVLAMVGMLMLVFIALSVVAVDIGRLGFTATEVQTVADIAATAGATAAVKGGNAKAQAQSVVALNSVDGSAASIAAGDVILGNYNSMTQTFTANAAPTNAVRANAMATVNNILASMVGTPTTTVEKTATAAFTTVQNANPTLPIAIGSCYFNNPCCPTLTQTPSTTNNTAWTTFFINNVSKSNIESYFPTPCGDGAVPPEINVGDHLQLGNGMVTPDLRKVQCLVDHGMRDFLIPVIQSTGSTCAGPLNQDRAVVGFATIHIDSVVTNGMSPGINLHGIINAGLPGTPGGDCPNCGTGFVVLVN